MYELSCMHNVCVLWLTYRLKSQRFPPWQQSSAGHIMNSEKQVRVMNIKVGWWAECGHTGVCARVFLASTLQVHSQTQKLQSCVQRADNKYSGHVVETKPVVSLNFLKPYWTCDLHSTVLTFGWCDHVELLTMNEQWIWSQVCCSRTSHKDNWVSRDQTKLFNSIMDLFFFKRNYCLPYTHQTHNTYPNTTPMALHYLMAVPPSRTMRPTKNA